MALRHTTKLLATFWVGPAHLAIDAHDVQEVLVNQPMVPVPKTEPSIRGLINLRGQVVTAITLAHRLGIAQPSDHYPTFCVVVRTDDGPVSLLVDSVGGVLNTEDLRCDPPPDTLDEAMQYLVTGVHQLEGDLLLVLDVARATEVRAGTSDNQTSRDNREEH
jgi:purine-binding chemotaxis protein CheW